jgi:large subunit ribosomal protein L25
MFVIEYLRSAAVSEVRLAAEVRTEFGKGGARRTRRAGKIPAVIYGHGADPRHVSLPAREFTHAIKRGGANVLLTLSVDGKDELTIPKAIQRHPIKGQYEHVDLISVRIGEKVTIDVPLVLTGAIAPGGLLGQDHTSVTVEAEATHLPTEIEVSIEGLEVGSHITAGDLILPAGSTLVTDAETLLVNVSQAPTEADMAAETEAGAEAEAAITAEAATAEEAAAE